MTGRVVAIGEALQARTPTIVSDDRFEAAVYELSQFVHGRVEQLAGALGFGYRPSRIAPSAFEGLLTEHKACTLTGLPLRVSSAHNEATVFTPDVNVRFRFWHDCTHVSTGGDFGRAGEAIVGQGQLRQLELAGHDPGSLVWRLLFCETFGQTECVHLLGSFPVDQRQFNRDYQTYGLPKAIEREGQRQGGESPFELSNVVTMRPRRPSSDAGRGDAA